MYMYMYISIFIILRNATHVPNYCGMRVKMNVCIYVCIHAFIQLNTQTDVSIHARTHTCSLPDRHTRPTVPRLVKRARRVGEIQTTRTGQTRKRLRSSIPHFCTQRTSKTFVHTSARQTWKQCLSHPTSPSNDYRLSQGCPSFTTGGSDWSLGAGGDKIWGRWWRKRKWKF